MSNKRAALYVRVSTDAQTVENQIRELDDVSCRWVDSCFLVIISYALLQTLQTLPGLSGPDFGNPIRLRRGTGVPPILSRAGWQENSARDPPSAW